MKLLTDTRGQAAVFTVLFVAALLGMAALVLDVGSWFRTSRASQAAADASALAGAQVLPEDPTQAASLALGYSGKNGGGLDQSGISFSSGLRPDDTITVTVHRSGEAFFSRVFGLNTVPIGATATARAAVPSAALGVRPIAVNRLNPMLACTPPPCAGPVQLSLIDLHNPGSGDAAGSFGLIDLDVNNGGSVGSGTVANWVEYGFSGLMNLGIYDVVPSTKYNSSQIDAAFAAVNGEELLFPVYDPPILKGGTNAEMNIVGWVGFHVTSASLTGAGGTLDGNFTRYIAEGVQSTGDQPDFGTYVIQLIN